MKIDTYNKGLGIAGEKIVAPPNSDDFYFKGTLQRVADVFQKNPDVDVVYGDSVFTDVNGKFINCFTEIEYCDRGRLLNHDSINSLCASGTYTPFCLSKYIITFARFYF